MLYYSDKVEEAHSQFANQAVQFFKKLTVGDGWTLDVAKDKLPSDLSAYDVVIMPDVAPGSKSDRARFQEYMENGGGWLGFHGAGYNDASTGWDWFRDFLGGVSFLCNTWPPFHDRTHGVEMLFAPERHIEITRHGIRVLPEIEMELPVLRLGKDTLADLDGEWD